MRPPAPPENPVLDAVKVVRLVLPPRGSEPSYCVTDDGQGEKRRQTRRRTRLRSGKLLSVTNRFLADCQVFDRAEQGARLRLCDDILLPLTLRYFDDEQEMLCDADLVWRSDREIGLRFCTRCEASAIGHDLLMRLRGRYYAVP